MRAALVALVLASGSSLLASSRPWLHVAAARPAPFGPVDIAVTGRTLYSGLFVLSVLPLLGGALVLVTRGLSRRVVGALLVVIGCLLAVPGARGLSHPSELRVHEVVGQHVASTAISLQTSIVTGWAVVVLVSAVLVIGCGGLVVVRAGRWQGGLARRYEAPADAATADDDWHALDRGDDPTIRGQ